MDHVDESTELPPLAPQELSLLDTWLRGLKSNLSLFYTHGFLCAVLTTPVEIPPTEWYPAMLPANLPDIVPEDEMKFHLDMLMQLKLELSESLSHDQVVNPLFDFHPMPPLQAHRLFQDQRTHLKEWCQSYLAGIALHREHWQPLQDVQHIVLTLQVIANEAQATKIMGVEHQNLRPVQIQTLIDQMIDSLPVLLATLYDQSCEIANPPKTYHKHQKTEVNRLFSQEKAKRQAPCPCGSHKPFDECCALNRETQH